MGGLILFLALGIDVVRVAVYPVEMLRTLGWVLFLLSLLNTLEASNARQINSRIEASLSNPLAVLASLIGFALLSGLLAFSGLSNQALVTISLTMTVATLVLLEQVWRNTAQGRRWALKFIGIALLLKFGLDIVVYSDALLFDRLPLVWWAIRGFASALLVPLIAIATARNKEWRLAMGVSREVVFYSATLLISGCFFLLVAIGGYALRLFGGSWGIVATGTFVFSAICAGLMLVASGAMRARLRVFIAKHFFSYRYNYREEWLRLARLMGSSGNGDSVINAASQRDANDTLTRRAIEGIGALVESTGGAIWLSDDAAAGNFRCEAVLNRPSSMPPLSASSRLLKFCAAHDTVIDLQQDAPNHPQWERDFLPTVIEQDRDAILLVPLHVEDELIGLVMLDRSRIKFPMNWEVYDMLKIAARQVASYLAIRRSTEALVLAEEFDTFNRMSAFVVHDLKNQVSQLSLVLSGADKHGHDPAYQKDVIETVREVFNQMQDLLLQLRSEPAPQGSAPASIPLIVTLRDVVKSRARPDLQPTLWFDPTTENVQIEAERNRFERAIGNLVQNAVEATTAEGKVQVEVKPSEKPDHVLIEVKDNGAGMSESFIRTRLFKPFTSTKQSGMGIGAFEANEFIRQLGGTLDVSSRPDEGTCFSIDLPTATEHV